MNWLSHKIFLCFALLVMVFNFGCATTGESLEEFLTITGTAAYRQRIAMPPDAVLSVQLEDVTLADAPSPLLAEFSEQFGDRQVPIPFTLQVPNTAVQAGHRYNLRATIKIGGALRFTSTRRYPVLTGGGLDQVEMLLDAVAANPSERSPNALPSQISLPATFSGTLPCADCPGVLQTLTLRGDGLYRLRRVYQDKPNGLFSEAGGWKIADNVLHLNNGTETSLFAIIADDILRPLDSAGQSIKTPANLDLRRASDVDPLNDSVKWRGEFIYMADAATFTDCASGLRWPVAMTGDYLTAERNYSKASLVPGSPLWIAFTGRLERLPGMEGPVIEQMVIEKFGTSHFKKACGSLASKAGLAVAELKNTYWKLLTVNDHHIPVAASPTRQIHMTLTSEGSRVSGFSGCNRFTGAFKHTGNKLHFSQMAGTMMACLAREMELESEVLKALGATTHYRIEGEHLLLLTRDKVVARFESVYLR
jgi:uncharacterized lipoprotein YbaY/heat shock protein HslJ/uncharacterized lipoprotein NlpE involved in copper resistance